VDEGFEVGKQARIDDGNELECRQEWQNALQVTVREGVV